MAFTFLGMPIKERDGARFGGKVCSYKGPTLSSSTATAPLVSRNGNEYEYLHAYMILYTSFGNQSLYTTKVMVVYLLFYPVQYMIVSAITHDPSTNSTLPSSCRHSICNTLE